jgi:hypothetical protein
MVFRSAVIDVYLLALVTLQAGAAEAVTDLHLYLTEQFFFDARVFFTDRRVTLGANGAITGEHPPVDFNEEFRLKDSDETLRAQPRYQTLLELADKRQNLPLI